MSLCRKEENCTVRGVDWVTEAGARALEWLAARCDAVHGVLRARLRCHEAKGGAEGTVCEHARLYAGAV